MSTAREITAADITRVVRDLCMEICYRVPPDMVEAMRRAREQEQSPLGRQILDQLLLNQDVAAEGEFPYCQDTGYTVVFLDVGQDVHVVGGDLYASIDEGVREGYNDGYLRGSIVRDPVFDRKNTGDNTPAFVHTTIVPGDQIRIQVDAITLGSHGESMVPLPRQATAGGKPLTELADEQTLERLYQRTRDAGAEIVGLLKKGSAYYAPSAAVAQMVNAIAGDTKEVLPVCAWCTGQYGISDVYVGVPARLGAAGVEEIVELDLSDQELAQLREAAEGIRGKCADLEKIG